MTDQQPIDQDAVELLHRSIVALRGHVSAIQKAKAVVADGGLRGPNPILECVNGLPEIIRWLDAAELDIEAAFEEYEDRAPPPVREGFGSSADADTHRDPVPPVVGCETVWVVTASRGEYSDRSEWAVEAYTTEAGGQAAVERLDAVDRAKKAAEKREWYHDDTTYYLSEVPLIAASVSPGMSEANEPKDAHPPQGEAEMREKIRTILEDTVDAELGGPFDDWAKVVPETLDAATDAILALTGRGKGDE